MAAKKKYFQVEDLNYLKFLIPAGLKILDLGCGLGDQLVALKPSIGIGVDFCVELIEVAKQRHANSGVKFIVGDIEDPNVINSLILDNNTAFDVILFSDVVGALEDCQQTFLQISKLCNHETRIIISYYSRAWDPIIRFAEIIQQKLPQPENNYLSTAEIFNLLELADLRPIKREAAITS